MSIFRNITANGMNDGCAADTVSMETTPDISVTPGVCITVTDSAFPDSPRAVTISLADGRELAGWLIEHCVEIATDPRYGPGNPPPEDA